MSSNIINPGKLKDNEYLIGYDKYKPKNGNVFNNNAIQIPESQQHVPDKILKLFKEYNRNKIEDPLYESFDLYIDEQNSPIFNKVNEYLIKYKDIPNVKKLNDFYNEFKNIIKMFFVYNEKTDKKTNIQYYINKISGLDKLNAKIVNYREDSINIELYEDVTFLSTYLAELYNNLTYCYINQRLMIPYNLLRFDLYIKLSDFRNFRNTKENPYIIYKLHDCNFDFYNSKSFSSEVVAAGLNQQSPTPSTIDFKIIYKSITRDLYPIIKKENGVTELEDRKHINNKSLKNNGDLGMKVDIKTPFKYPQDIVDIKTPFKYPQDINVYNTDGTIQSKRNLLLDSLLNEIIEARNRDIVRPIINKIPNFVKNIIYTNPDEWVNSIERKLVIGAIKLLRNRRELPQSYMGNVINKSPISINRQESLGKI